MWPRALFTAARSTTVFFYDMQRIRVKGAFGFQLNGKEQQFERAVGMYKRNQQTSLTGDEPTSLHQPTNDEKGRQLDMGKESQRQDDFGITLGPDKFIKMPLVRVKLPVEGLMYSHFFFVDWMRNLLNEGDDPYPPGCCLITGDVEVLGSLARCKLGVAVSYNPKTGQMVWFRAKMKQVWQLQYTPKGGP